MKKIFDHYVFTTTRMLRDCKSVYIASEACEDKLTSARCYGNITTALFLLGIYLALNYKENLEYSYFCEYNENISPDENVDYVIKKLSGFFKMER